MTKTYNRLAVGERLRVKRTLLRLTQEQMAERINRVTKYYADIERGSCGMSVETLMALCEELNMTMDYLIYGEITEEEAAKQKEETGVIMSMLEHCSSRKRKYAKEMLKLFLIACDNYEDKEKQDEASTSKE